MTSWVVSIDKQHPGHWKIAKEHAFWDLTRHRPIQQGDLVYFWQAGKSFLAQTRATTDAHPLQPGMTASWEDSGARQYASRFGFEVLDEAPTTQPRWVLDVGPQLVSKTPDLRSIPGFDNPADETLLASYFGGTATSRSDTYLEKELQALLQDVGAGMPDVNVETLGDDAKTLVEKLVVVREGQKDFRAGLVKAYGACAITGYSVEAALDAAHIRPYAGAKSQHVSNGLLLRSDLHRLLDRHLITVTPDHVVHVSPDLGQTPYADLDGLPLKTVPKMKSGQPNADLLHEHNGKCAWLNA